MQRFCVQHKIKMSRLNSCFLTRLTPDACGGLPGEAHDAPLIPAPLGGINLSLLHLLAKKAVQIGCNGFVKSPQNWLSWPLGIELMPQQACSVPLMDRHQITKLDSSVLGMQGCVSQWQTAVSCKSCPWILWHPRSAASVKY